ncbi:hypothetical protein ACT3XG_01455 [Paenibacillus polymyxa]|jgi:hypothetical protein|uniref:hypothetical protein n=1 Tax=Paenibacillus TaxID=44249 RepID=UPI00030A4E97|nr:MULTISPECIES: hypothetical protein [Paenibacillus]AHM64007.1 hypothetical protein PPSQR21_002960 [Paenibacillus polymyxa SQR-21]AIY09706.1 hypothetical protein LK13_14445 [Paenibacillus polymyxa]KAE8560281.1 hypothetical protein BJH92_09835 [Paenibacillus polymyxa]KAF6562125.1 hypothetical protein G9G63_19570 [Paenibacillus sp. EKM202P]KAF6566473.1 hypothetical protein G9G64_18785 [Paenibacillus sp. EKM207P]
MNRKRMLVICTLLLALSIGQSSTWGSRANAAALAPERALHVQDNEASKDDDLLKALGISSDEQLYDALYNGQTLADIAQTHNQDAQAIVDLQVAQLTEQLDQRLANKSITLEQYQAHKAELTQVVAKSVFGL